MAATNKRSIPYYQQVANVLRARIVSMESDQPERLATEQELCQIHRVSRITVRRALEILQTEGLIERTPGRGTLTAPAGIRAWRRLRQTRLIRVITTHISRPDDPLGFYSAIHQGMFSRGEQEGYNLSLKHISGPFAQAGPELEPEDSSRIVGLILIGISDERMIGMHVDAGYPVVCVDYWPKNAGADAVIFDCFDEGQQAAEFLISQGHTNLFYIGNITGTGPNLQNEADAELMAAGFVRGVRLAGLSLPSDRIRYCRAMAHDSEVMAEWVASLAPKPVAGVVFTSDVAQGLRAALGEHGLSCPRDVSLITKSFVGHPLDMTTLVGDAFLMGQLAVESLLDRASGRRERAVRLAMPSMLRRGTTVRSVKG